MRTGNGALTRENTTERVTGMRLRSTLASSSLSEWGDVRSLLATRCMGTWVDVRTGSVASVDDAAGAGTAPRERQHRLTRQGRGLASVCAGQDEHPLDVPCHGHEGPLATHIVKSAQ